MELHKKHGRHPNQFTWGLGILTPTIREEYIRQVKVEYDRLLLEKDLKRQYNEIYYMFKYGKHYRHFI